MPRVSLSVDALGYMTKIGVSAEKGARLIHRAPRAERPQPVAVPVEARPAQRRAHARILRTFFKMLAILACIIVFLAVLDSVRAAEGNLGTIPPIVLAASQRSRISARVIGSRGGHHDVASRLIRAPFR